jgi:ribose transport system ATP-binding protein
MPHAAATGLFFDRVEKHFGGTYALRNVSLNVGRGEIVALLGENGAGKSTLIKILGGIHLADAGGVLVDGTPYTHVPGAFGARQSVAFIHQDLGLIEWMTVAENIGLALGYARAGGLISWRRVEAFAQAALDKVGCDIAPTSRVGDLSRTEKSLVAIARALAVDCDFLVLDEPTASLPADEVERLFVALRRLRDQNVGMIYVSHRLDEIFQISDRVAVLRDGVMVGIRDTRHTTPEELVHLIVGRKLREVVKLGVPASDTLLAVDDLRCGAVGPASFALKSHEVLGLIGLRGAGHEAVARALFGQGAYSGTITLAGNQIAPGTAIEAMAQGIGLIARDRTEESVAGVLSVRENMFLNPGASGRGKWAFLTPRTEANAARKLGAGVTLSPNDPGLAVEALSGGNQQKVVVARWLETGRKLLICEDPTAGVDVGAKAEIYALLNSAAQNGVGIIIVSTDFEEVAAICQRAIVFSQGRIVTELSGPSLTTDQLIQSASASNMAPELSSVRSPVRAVY